MAGGVAHQRKAAVEDALVGESAQKLIRTLQPCHARGRHRGYGADGTLGESGDAVACARDAVVLGFLVGLERGAEPLRAGIQPDTAAFDIGAQKLRREAARNPRILRVMDLCVGAECAWQAFGARIEPLARDSKKVFSTWKRSGRRAQLGAAMILRALPRRQRPARLAHDVRDQIGAHRHRHFGGGCWRRRALVGCEVDQSHVGFVADGGNERDHAVRRGADHDLLVERPQVLQRAAAARDDQQIRPADAPAFGQRVEAVDGGRDLLGRAFALHLHRPDDDVAREAVGQAMQDVADHRARGRRDDADRLRQIGNELLARFVEQAFGGELALALLKERHQRAEARGLQRLDDDLIFGRSGEGRELAGGNDLEAFFHLEAHAAEHALPDHGFQNGLVVLQAKIDVAGRVRAAIARDFAAHTHVAVGVLDCALERLRQLGDGEFRDVGLRLVHVGDTTTLHEGGLCQCMAAADVAMAAAITKRRAERPVAAATMPAPNGKTNWPSLLPMMRSEFAVPRAPAVVMSTVMVMLSVVASPNDIPITTMTIAIGQNDSGAASAAKASAQAAVLPIISGMRPNISTSRA